MEINSSHRLNSRPQTRPYLMMMGILASACTGGSTLRSLEKISNKAAIDQFVKQWAINPEQAELRNEALSEIMDCARDSALNDENRAYCLQVLNGLSGKNDQALEQINGLVLPTRVVKLSKAFEKLSAPKAR